MNKRLMAAALAGLLVASAVLSGCQSGQGETSTANVTEISQESPEEMTATEPASTETDTTGEITTEEMTVEAADLEEEILVSILGETTYVSEPVNESNAVFSELEAVNEVLAAWSSDAGYIVKVKIYYGEPYYDDPSMEVYAGFDMDGNIVKVVMGDTVDHTEEFLSNVTQEYLDSTYADKPLSQSFEADTVSGATYSGSTVLFAVQLASYYAGTTFGIGKAAPAVTSTAASTQNSQDIQLNRLVRQLDGNYTKEELNPDFTSDTGEITYVATGTTADGHNVAAFIVETRFTPDNEESTMEYFVIQTFVDTDSSQIISSLIATTGVDMYLEPHIIEVFELSDEKLESYNSVEITSADAFDDFTDGLVTDNPVDAVTSATGSFTDAVTGATPEGTDTSRAIHGAFCTVAQYYAENFLN